MQMQLDKARLEGLKRNFDTLQKLTSEQKRLAQDIFHTRETLEAQWDAACWQAKAKEEMPIDYDIPDLIDADGRFNVEVTREGVATWKDKEASDD